MLGCGFLGSLKLSSVPNKSTQIFRRHLKYAIWSQLYPNIFQICLFIICLILIILIILPHSHNYIASYCLIIILPHITTVYGYWSTGYHKNFLRKLFTKRPRFRESEQINFDKAKSCILTGLEDCIQKWCNKNDVNKSLFMKRPLTSLNKMKTCADIKIMTHCHPYLLGLHYMKFIKMLL